MAVQNATTVDEAPNDNHTELTETIKISLSKSTNAHSELCTQYEVLQADGSDMWPDEHRCSGRVAVAGRQKTNIVLHTREECESLLTVLKFSHCKSRRSRKSLERVKDELVTELKFQGLWVNRESSEHYPVLEEYDGVLGTSPEDLKYEVDDLVKVSWRGERKGVRIAKLGAEKALLERKHVRIVRAWVEYDAIKCLDTESMEERARERNRVSPRDKRMQADLDKLADLCKVHALQVCDDVWGSTINVEEIDFEFNARFSWLGGRYTPRVKSDGPKVELSPGMYYAHGLEELLEVVRHEMIHAWQNYHPDGHPRDTYRHHGRDFTQWLDDMKTHRHCKYY